MRVREGATHQARTNMPWQGEEGHFADLRIEAAYWEFLWEMDDRDIYEEGYDSLDDYIAVWQKINGTWDEDMIVAVVGFGVVR